MPFTLSFDHKGDFEVNAACGKWKGEYQFNCESITIEMKRNLMSGCRKNAALQFFLGDLERAVAAFIHDDRLIITLGNGEGSIYFERR